MQRIFHGQIAGNLSHSGLDQAAPVLLFLFHRGFPAKTEKTGKSRHNGGKNAKIRRRKKSERDGNGAWPPVPADESKGEGLGSLPLVPFGIQGGSNALALFFRGVRKQADCLHTVTPAASQTLCVCQPGCFLETARLFRRWGHGLAVKTSLIKGCGNCAAGPHRIPRQPQPTPASQHTRIC